LATALVSLSAREFRATRHAALAIIAAALYWLIVATFWNGVIHGAWSAEWLTFGAPGLFGAVTLAVFALVRLWQSLIFRPLIRTPFGAKAL
jgi:hypothetical protein